MLSRKRAILVAVLALVVLAGPVEGGGTPGEKVKGWFRPRALDPQLVWAHIVAGESGGGWLEGSRLVAWTLRAWEVYKGMPAGGAGPDWGWYGWSEPGYEARQVVAEVWGQPMSAAPFEFMRQGRYCQQLGSRLDALWWAEIGWHTDPAEFIITHPGWPDHTMNCYFAP